MLKFNPSFYRIMIALIVGLVLVIFPQNAADYLVIAVGVIFMLPSIFSIVSHFTNRGETRPPFPVDALGSFPVPVEVLPDASRVVIQALEDMGASCEIRMAQRKDGPVITDNGNFVIDAKFSEIESPAHLEIDLNSIPGVVENGIFSQMVDKVIVGTPEGTKEL